MCRVCLSNAKPLGEGFCSALVDDVERFVRPMIADEVGRRSPCRGHGRSERREGGHRQFATRSVGSDRLRWSVETRSLLAHDLRPYRIPGRGCAVHPDELWGMAGFGVRRPIASALALGRSPRRARSCASRRLPSCISKASPVCLGKISGFVDVFRRCFGMRCVQKKRGEGLINLSNFRGIFQ